MVITWGTWSLPFEWKWKETLCYSKYIEIGSLPKLISNSANSMWPYLQSLGVIHCDKTHSWKIWQSRFYLFSVFCALWLDSFNFRMIFFKIYSSTFRMTGHFRLYLFRFESYQLFRFLDSSLQYLITTTVRDFIVWFVCRYNSIDQACCKTCKTSTVEQPTTPVNACISLAMYHILIGMELKYCGAIRSGDHFSHKIVPFKWNIEWISCYSWYIKMAYFRAIWSMAISTGCT